MLLCCLEVLSDLGKSSLHFHFALGPISSVLSPAPEPRNPLKSLKERGAVRIQRRVGERKGGSDKEGLRSNLEVGEPDNQVRQERQARDTVSEATEPGTHWLWLHGACLPGGRGWGVSWTGCSEGKDVL